jgi:hypothetical protein
MPPGFVSQGQLLHSPLIPGYVQPIEILVPDGVRVSFNLGGKFEEPRTGPVRVGMLVGPIYQLRITHIPFREGFEVYPTIEVINRLYAPPEQAQSFSVPVQLTLEEIEFALDGRYVTRVIYLEDAETAAPVREDPSVQRFFEAPPGQDPLRIADQLGRPMAILRMGSRIPEAQELSRNACPPVFLNENRPQPSSGAPAVARGSRGAIERGGAAVPRVPLPQRTASRPFSAGGSITR